MGKRLTTGGLAASANSVITACISSRSRNPLEVSDMGALDSAAEANESGQRAAISVPARKAAFPIVDISRAMFLVYPTCTTKPMGRNLWEEKNGRLRC